jgi:hydrogenase nickel incorporation protein HypB
VLTKIDLAGPCEFDRDRALENIQRVRPGIPVFELSTKTGEGVAAWLEFLILQREVCIGTKTRADHPSNA